MVLEGSGGTLLMSIAAANLFTKNIYKEFIRRRASDGEQARVSKLASLVVKFGALAFVLSVNTQNSINLQLLGGVWILQTFPALAVGLFTKWLHRWALLVGWAAGMVYGTIVAYNQSSAVTKHFGASTAKVPLLGQSGYIGLTAFILNLLVAIVLTVILRLMARTTVGADETSHDDYVADADVRGPALAD